MAIVIFCVALVFIFRWLTREQQDIHAYLSALNSDTRPTAKKEQDALKLLTYIQESKRWQSIYDVTQQLQFNRKAFLAQNPEFPAKVARAFQRSKESDHRLRQYLVQVLGLVGGEEAVSVLLEALKDTDSEIVIHSMISLGRLEETRALPPLVEISQSSDRGLRQTAIFVLGNFHDPTALERCAQALDDSDPLVQWNAAFALARQKDARSVPILERLLDGDYVDRVAKNYMPTRSPEKNQSSHSLATFQPERLEQYRATAIQLLGKFKDASLRKELERVASSDKQLKVRQAAIETLKSIKNEE